MRKNEGAYVFIKPSRLTNSFSLLKNSFKTLKASKKGQKCTFFGWLIGRVRLANLTIGLTSGHKSANTRVFGASLERVLILDETRKDSRIPEEWYNTDMQALCVK